MCKEQYADLIWDHDEAAHKKYKEHLAPIVLFTYNRLEHTKKTVAALQQNIYANDSELYIYSDGARDAKALASIEAVRKFLHTVDGFKSVQIIERDRNWGLAENIIDGVTKIVNSHGKVIVLEDDIVTSRYFLKYMNDALEVYRDDSRIMEVSGYMYPMDTKDLPETFFLKMGDCWGWGTWSRAWRSFERNPEELMKAFSAEEVYHFNLEGAEDFWAQVKANVTGELHTWAVFWMAAIVRHDGLMLCSRESLSQNIGMDGSGEHCGQTGSYEANLKKEAIYSFPLLVAENKLARENLRQFFLHEHKNNRTLNKVYGGGEKKVTVVIPTYNRAFCIDHAIQSVLTQKYPGEIEILVCDDFSHDDTRGKIESISRSNKNRKREIVFLQRQDGKKGANWARNYGIEMATGAYITFLDSDDEFYPDVIEKRVQVLEENHDIDFVYGDIAVDHVPVQYDDIEQYDQHSYLMEELSLCCFSVIMVRKSAFQQVSLLNGALKAWQDDNIVLNFDRARKKMKHCHMVIANMRRVDKSISVNFRNRYDGLNELLRDYKSDIIEFSRSRYFLWRLRLLLDLYLAKADETGGLRHFGYFFASKSLFYFLRAFFRHIYG